MSENAINHVHSLEVWSSIPVRNKILVSTVTLFNIICFLLTMMIAWYLNRQTQIRKSKSQTGESGDYDSSVADEFDFDFEDENSDCDFFNEDPKHNQMLQQERGGEKGHGVTVTEHGMIDYSKERKDSSRSSRRAKSIIFHESEPECEIDEDESTSAYTKRKAPDNHEPTTSMKQPQKRRGIFKGISEAREQKQKELLDIVSKVQVFSYLSPAAVKECLAFMEYINLPEVGMCLSSLTETKTDADGNTNTNYNLDGSLYVVVSGEVTCTCEIPPKEHDDTFNSSSTTESTTRTTPQLTFTAGPGDVATSLLFMLSGLVKEYQERKQLQQRDRSNSVSSVNSSGNEEEAILSLPTLNKLKARVISSKENTRLIRVPPKCFLSVLDKFPHDVHLIVQTVLARTQRVTIQTLVQNLGLDLDILRHNRESKHLTNFTQHHKDVCRKSASDALSNIQENHQDVADEGGIVKLSVSYEIKKEIATIAARNLGSYNPKSIEVIQNSLSIVSVPPGHILVNAGSKPKHLYLVIDGELEAGSFIQHQDTKYNGLTFPSALFPQGKSVLSEEVLIDDDDDDDDVTTGTAATTSSSSKNATTTFRCINRIHSNEAIGQMACLTGDISTVTIRSKMFGPKSSLLKRATLIQIPVHTHQSVIDREPGALIHCIDYILREISSVIHIFDWGLKWLHVKAGDVIAKKGQNCECMYVVINGKLMSGDKSSKNSGDCEGYSRGKCIGDALVITGGEWQHDVYAIRNSELAMIPVDVLDTIMRIFPDAGIHFAKIIASHVQEKNKRNKKGHKVSNPVSLPSYGLNVATIAVVPLQETSLSEEELSNISQVVSDRLGNIAPCKIMTKSLAKKSLGEKIFEHRNATSEVKLAQLLGDLEENYRLVVYQTSMKFTWWTKLCIQQADCVLLVANAEETPSSSRVEQYLSWSHKAHYARRVDLVVLQRVTHRNPTLNSNNNTDNDNIITSVDDRVPVNDKLNDWSEKRPWINCHHLIRVPLKAHEMDVNRMCRRITGRSIGLVLGGGGARGLAHLGVIKALMDAGVTIDMVGGTSQGAFIGALFAKSPDNYDELLKSSKLMADGMASIKEKIADLTLPIVSYFNGYRFNKTIAETIGKQTRIQDLVLNFFCISTDLRKASQAVHTKGLCWKYVRASMGLHGYLPPVSEDGSLLLDGGYTNLVPGDVMSKEMGAHTVIAVDVSSEKTAIYHEYGANLSGWWLLWNSWNPFVKTVRVPSMAELSQKLIWVSSRRQLMTVAEDHADLFLTPHVKMYGTLEYDKFDEIIEKGYEHAKPQIRQLLKERPWLIEQNK